MKYKTLLGAVFALALVLAACAPAAPPTNPPPTLEPTTVATEPPATDTQAATEAPVATDTPSVDTTETVGVPVTGAVTINVADVGTYGSALVDGNGMSLYVTSKDTPGSGTSSCTDDCAVEWPPLLTEGDPVAGEGVDATLLGTITLDDGTTQVTYNGHPLHFFDEDKAAGDTNGQGVDDEFGHWNLISPAGEPIQ